MRHLVLSAVAAIACLGGCSLAIDVPADCTDDVCGAYVCAADGVACLDACGSDDDCASGFLCDPLNARCEAAACRLDGDVVTLALPDAIGELALAWADPAQGSEQFMAVVSGRSGIGLQRFGADGRPGGDPVSDSGLFEIRTENSSRRQFFPSAGWVDAGTLSGVSAAFTATWVDVSQTPDRLFVTTFPFAPQVQAPTHVAAVAVSRSVELLDSAWASQGDRGVLVWHQRSSASGDNVLVVATEPDGTARSDETQLNPDDRPAEGVVAARAGEHLVVAYTLNDEGTLRLVLSPIDADGAPGGVVDIDPGGADARTTDLADLRAHAVDDGVVLTWALESTGSTTWHVAQVTGDELRDLAGGSLSVPSAQVESPVADAEASWATVAAGDVWWVFVGRAEGRDAMWLLRTDAEGTARESATPFAAHPGDLIEGTLMARSNGAALVAVTPGEDADVTRLWRIVCEP